MPARGDHALRGVPLGLLDEPLDGVYLDRGFDVELVPRLDIPEPGVRPLRRDPERHEVTAVGRRGRGDEHLPELPAVADHVIGRKHRDDRVRVEGAERRHREPDRGGVAARVRLDDEVVER